MNDNNLLRKHQRKSKIKETGLSLLFLSPYLLNFLTFFIIPIVSGFFMSFFNYDPYNAEAFKFVLFKNYERIFAVNVYSKYFWNAFKITILFDIVAVPCLIIIPLLLAYLINIQPPGYKLFRAIIYLPSVISISIVGIIFSAIFSSDVNGFFNATFHTNINFLNDANNPLLRWFIILLASIWWQTGGNFVIILAALKNVPKSLYEACEIDGGNKWHSFIKVTLPNIKSSLGVCLFNTLIGYLSLYGQPTVLQGAVFASDYDSPMILIQSLLGDPSKSHLTGFVTAMAIVFGLIVMALTIIERTVMKERRKGYKHEKRYYQYLASKESI